MFLAYWLPLLPTQGCPDASACTGMPSLAALKMSATVAMAKNTFTRVLNGLEGREARGIRFFTDPLPVNEHWSAKAFARRQEVKFDEYLHAHVEKYFEPVAVRATLVRNAWGRADVDVRLVLVP